ncbi:hypothetical protein FBZ87_101348 [Nitrospirillum amazonense]|uniref:DUF4412 domain-containing protein n=1 Tax=Nitrospirillum amazonense TaxID=28077 RepID=A0A560KHQ9_9PROT|nr:hypothetical protein [Nitrospirillum amazonense]TWB82639.1 hypothetical protein FBZ87_101348 [Nitrospirillum amazonense]
MRRSILLAAMLLLSPAALAQSAPAKPAPSKPVSDLPAGGLPKMGGDYQAAEALTVNGVRQDLRVYHDQGRERREMREGGLSTILILRPDRDTAFVLQPESHMAAPLSPQDPEAAPDLTRLSQLDAEALGRDTLGGEAVVRYRVIGTYDQGGGFEGQVWSTADGIYMRVEGTANDGNGPVTIRLDLADLKRGRQDGALFELPKGYTMMNFGPIDAPVPEGLRGDTPKP